MICHSLVYAAIIYLQEFLQCVLKCQLHVLLEMSVGDVDRINSNKGIPTIKGDGVSSTT